MMTNWLAANGWRYEHVADFEELLYQNICNLN
jgi:hypothetical protein